MAAYWISQSKRLLRAISPIDFPEDAPIYIISRSELDYRFDASAGCGGYTNATLDLKLKDELKSIGEWFGRGFSTVIFDGLIRSLTSSLSPGELDDHLIRLVLHEVCHRFQRGRSVTMLEDETNWEPVMQRAMTAIRQEMDSKPDPPKKTPWENHESDFIRTALHIQYRAEAVGFPVRISDLWHSEFYKLGPIEEHAEALDDEPQRRVGESLFDIAESEPPADFIQFAAEDLQRAKGRHEQL